MKWRWLKHNSFINPLFFKEERHIKYKKVLSVLKKKIANPLSLNFVSFYMNLH